jgi:hypothetical protein
LPIAPLMLIKWPGSARPGGACPRFAVGRDAALGIDLTGLLLSESAGGEAAGSGGSGLQVVAPFPEPIEDFAVAGGQGHLEVGPRFRGGQIEDGVDQSGSGSDRQVAGLHMQVCVDRWAVGGGTNGGFGQNLVVVGQGDVLRCAGHVGFSRAVCSTTGGQQLNKPQVHAGRSGALTQGLGWYEHWY